MQQNRNVSLFVPVSEAHPFANSSSPDMIMDTLDGNSHRNHRCMIAMKTRKRMTQLQIFAIASIDDSSVLEDGLECGIVIAGCFDGCRRAVKKDPVRMIDQITHGIHTE